MSPTAAQRRAAVALIGAVSVGFGVLAPFATIPLGRVDGFVTAVLTIVFVTDLATTVLLFSEFAVVRSRALLLLASAYLVSALTVAMHALTFPGAFTPTGLLGAGLQTSPWLYLFWHAGLPVAVIGYAVLKDRGNEDTVVVPPIKAVAMAAAVAAGLVIALTWSASQDFMPRLLDNAIMFGPLAHTITGLLALTCVIALGLLWVRQQSILDLWLMVALCALLAELALVTVFVPGRFNLAYYCGRLLSVAVSTAVLGILIVETIKLYAALSRAAGMLQRERESKRLNLEAAVAAISHDVRQPLTALAAKGSAGRNWLARTPPDIERVQQLLDDMVAASFCANDALVKVESLLKSEAQEKQPIDANELILGALRLMREELKSAGITTRVELSPKLPLLDGHKGQLQDAILSLIQNAIDAMTTAAGSNRILGARTDHLGPNSIGIWVEDSGPGIDAEKMDRIFCPFVTTKPARLGLGLAVCRTIVESHGGALTVASNPTKGARFEIKLPTRERMQATTLST
jgi:signal transduction histidine kinase